jgi:regulator of sirC expression with transglutaminase-like and TPR domain
LRQAWPGWFRLKGDKERLETALSLIADFQYGRTYPVKLKALLDHLAEEYQSNFKVRNIFELAHFLFKVKQLRGAKKDYYDPFHSNLVHVIKEKRGIPISLASIYILVGHRLGLNIQGCNFPGHFLARVHSKDKSFLVDCFDGGRFMDEKDLMEAHSASSKIVHDIIQAEPDSITMIGRVLRNLVQAYQYSQDWDNSDFMLELIKSLDNIRVGHDDVKNH